jgi:hypothetical protein
MRQPALLGLTLLEITHLITVDSFCNSDNSCDSLRAKQSVNYAVSAAAAAAAAKLPH